MAGSSTFHSQFAERLPKLFLKCAKRVNPFHSQSFHAQLAQGATEYLVILAVVLIVALIGVALVGFVPGASSDAKVLQSETYWRAARPFSILERTVLANGTVTLVVQSKEATGTYTLTRINVSSGAYNSSTSFGPGETKTLAFSGVAAGNANSYYDFSVNISYTSPYGITGVQRGTKSMMGKYS